MPGRFADLDALFAEIDERPVEIAMYGRRWQCPADPPADTMLRLQAVLAYAAERRDDPDAVDVEVPDSAALDMWATANDMCGADNVEQWREMGIGKKRLWMAIYRVLAIHNGYGDDDPADAEGDDDGEGKPGAPPAGASPTSSNTSASSKRTSTASTASDSATTSGT